MTTIPRTHDRQPPRDDSGSAGNSLDHLQGRRASAKEIRENRLIATGLAAFILVGGGIYYALNQGGGESHINRQQQIENAANAAWAEGHRLPDRLPTADK